MRNENMFEELMYYTLSKYDEEFIHQHVVDAYAAQNADSRTKKIKIFFALAGLYLYLEKDYTGKEIQNAHVKMTKVTKDYPSIDLPAFRGELTIEDVLNELPGTNRDDMIRKWCQSVWKAYQEQHQLIKINTDSILRFQSLSH